MNASKKILISLSTGLLLIGTVGCQQNTQSSNKNQQQVQNNQSEKNEPIKLSKTYTTKFGKINQITYPEFQFDYSDNWKIKMESVSENSAKGEVETVVLTNKNNVEIQYTHIMESKDFNFNTGNVEMNRVEISKSAASQFIPGYVQATNHKSLGTFMVAKLKTTGQLNMQTEKDYHDIDGSVKYAVLPEKRNGKTEDIRGFNEGVFSFWYSGHIAFTASALDGKFNAEDEEEVIRILSTFRVKEVQ